MTNGRFLALLALAVSCQSVHAAPAANYLISTLAGGLPFPTAASAINYPLLSVTGVAVDAAGGVFISSSWNCVFRLDTAGNLIRVAGTGVASYSGDGGPAVAATLNGPAGLALDSAGNLYIADSRNHRIRQVSPDGVITTFAGTGMPGHTGDGGPASAAQLFLPHAVAVDSNGNVYISDTGNDAIRKVSAGTIVSFAGRASGLRHPLGIALDGAGNLYVADSGNHRVLMVTSDGMLTPLAGNSPLANPSGVAVDRNGRVYVADMERHRVLAISGGAIDTLAGGSRGFRGDGGPVFNAQFDSPADVAFDAAGNLYVADSRNGRIRKITAGARAISTVAGSGAAPLSGDGGPASLARFSNRSQRMAVAADRVGNVYFTDNDNHRVRKVAPDGTVGSVVSAQLNAPAGMQTDAAGNLYIADAGSCRIYRVDLRGAIATFAGTGSCQYLDPHGMAFDSAGSLYVADTGNNRIRKITPDGAVSTVIVGEVQLDHPLAVAVDAAGNLYIADTGNRVVRKLTRSGVVSTLDDGGTPEGIAVDGGNIYIAISSGSYRAVRKISVDGAVRTIAEEQFALPSDIAVDSSGKVYVADQGNNTVRVLVPAGQQPVLTVSSARSSNFTPGSTADYVITVSNGNLAAATSGTVTVAESLPAGLTLVSLSGPGWNCSTYTCWREDSLKDGASYPPLTLTMSVADSVPPQLSNVVTVAGGGSIGASVMDVTNISGRQDRSSAAAVRPATAAAALQITTTRVVTATQYQDYLVPLNAIGGQPPYSWEVLRTQNNVSLPEGMSLDPNTGVVSATQVNGQGGYEVAIQVTDSATPTPNTATAILDFGVVSDPSFAGCPAFPPDSIFNQRIDQLPVDLNPTHQIPANVLGESIHPDFGHGFYPSPSGIPWMRVPANQPITNLSLENDGQIDLAGTYQWPIPAWPNAVVEGTAFGGSGSDHHILVLQTSTNNITGPQTGDCKLFETYQNGDVPSSYDPSTNTWSVLAGSHYDLSSDAIAASIATLDTGAQDSPGIPMVPLLLPYTAVPMAAQHPLRIAFSGSTNWYAWPATGCCTGNGPPQGLLYRLKASVNWQASCPPSNYPQSATVLTALQQYGAYMSDHGADGFLGGVPDIQWDDDDLACMKRLTVGDLEVVDNSALDVSSTSGQTRPYVAPATLPVFAVGAAYSASLWTTGGNPAARHLAITSGGLPPGLSLDPVAGTISGTPASSSGNPYVFGVTASDTSSGLSSGEQQFWLGLVATPLPDLTVVAWHSGNYKQGQTGLVFNLNVTNAGTAPTSGTVSVSDTLPIGMSATAMSGTGWNCNPANFSCTRSDALAAGGSYPLSVTVNAGYVAPYSVANTAAVSGGGEVNTANDQASDIIIVSQLPDLTLTCTHTGNFTQGQTGATYTISVTNIGQPDTNGPVTVVDTLPAGMTATAIGGAGWNCTLATLTCTRNDGLTGRYTATVYYPLTITVNVSSSAAANLTNVATVSGGAEGNTANDQASDPTTVAPLSGLTVSSTHTGNFVQGQIGAIYTVTVSNMGGVPTTAAVSVNDTLPSGFVATAIGGSGWACTLSTLTCTYSGAIAAGTSAALTVTVNVAGRAGVFTNVVTLSGGGATTIANNQASDPTTVSGACDVNRDGNQNVTDVQLVIDQALGTMAPASDLNGDATVNVADVQIVINAVLTLGCAVGLN